MALQLLFGVHAHQPVGNFDHVIEDAHRRCYRPFLQVMADYPEFRFAVHFSGWLLDELERRWPEDMALLATMTRRGQVEWFGSGDCEPVLAAIPHRDRVSQIVTLSDKIERRYGVRPQGAWLTERVWESAVVPSLADCGIRYVAVDDYHFLCTGKPAAALDGFFSTEEDGRWLDLFPISEQARYRLPFSPAHEVVAWLEEQARQGQKASVYFDDIEKFGIWPETHAWVYGQGWLRQFIEGVLASPHIETTTYADFHARYRTRGIVYLPTTSYSEMNEWTLPAAAARRYARLIQRAKAEGQLDEHKPFLRGGIWRNFFSRYAEANWLHKRMLAASDRLAALPAKKRNAQMQEWLHRAQANDAYWHGLFGGLYLPHLRRAVWHNLLCLEAALQKIDAQAAPWQMWLNAPPQKGGAKNETFDADLDGHDERFLRSKELLAVVRLDGDGALIELSSLSLAHNFGDTLRRYEEAYHDRLHLGESQSCAHGGIASAHERIAFRHEIHPGDADPDPRPRSSFIDSWIDADGKEHFLNDYALQDEIFRCPCAEGAIEKRYVVEGNVLTVGLRTLASGGRLQTRLNLAMPSCDGPAGRYVLADGSIAGGFGEPLSLTDATKLTLEDAVLGGAIALTASQPVHMEARAHLTVSQSEAGFEKIMQAVELTLSWPAMHGQETIVTVECRRDKR